MICQVIDSVCKVSTLWPKEDVKMIWGIVITSLQFFIHFLILIICYGQIIWVLTKELTLIWWEINLWWTILKFLQQILALQHRLRTLVKICSKWPEENTIKTLLIVGLCFIICWSQNQITYFMYNCGYDLNFKSTYHQFTTLMVFINCTVNPFIYLIQYRDYQEALKVFLHCNKKQESKSSLNSSTLTISNTTMISQIA